MSPVVLIPFSRWANQRDSIQVWLADKPFIFDADACKTGDHYLGFSFYDHDHAVLFKLTWL